MATPTPARSTADAARLYARDGLFWMRDVLTAAEIEELRAAAGASFAEVLRALLVQHAMAEAAGRDPSASSMRAPACSPCPAGTVT